MALPSNNLSIISSWISIGGMNEFTVNCICTNDYCSIIVFDNIHLPIGDIRLRSKGSSGGQNGVQNIIDQLKTDQFPRLAMGVGPVPKVCYCTIGMVFSNRVSRK